MTTFVICYEPGPNGHFIVEDTNDYWHSNEYVSTYIYAFEHKPEGWVNPVVPCDDHYLTLILAPDVKKAIDTFWVCYEQIGE